MTLRVADEVMGLDGRRTAAAAALPAPKGVAKTDMIRLRLLSGQEGIWAVGRKR